MKRTLLDVQSDSDAARASSSDGNAEDNDEGETFTVC